MVMWPNFQLTNTQKINIIKLKEGYYEKIISICALTALSFTLIGCTSTSATDKASQAKQEHTQNTFQLNSANITDIEILKTTNHTTSKSQTDNEKMIQSIVSAVQKGTPKQITLDQKRENLHILLLLLHIKMTQKKNFLCGLIIRSKFRLLKMRRKIR